MDDVHLKATLLEQLHWQAWRSLKKNQQKTGLCWIKNLLEESLWGFNYLNVVFEAIILVRYLNFYVEAV